MPAISPRHPNNTVEKEQCLERPRYISYELSSKLISRLPFLFSMCCHHVVLRSTPTRRTERTAYAASTFGRRREITHNTYECTRTRYKLLINATGRNNIDALLIYIYTYVHQLLRIKPKLDSFRNFTVSRRAGVYMYRADKTAT